MPDTYTLAYRDGQFDHDHGYPRFDVSRMHFDSDVDRTAYITGYHAGFSNAYNRRNPIR